MADSQRKTANLWDERLETGTLSENKSPIGSTYQQCKLDTASQRVRSANAIHTNGVATISFNSSKYNLFVLFFDNDVLYTGEYEGWKTDTFTVNSPYIGIVVKPISGNISPDADDFNIMINSGSTPLPYEPYWQHSLRKLGTSTDALTTLPADVYADGNNATVGLVGNMVQSGSPSPSSPIQPQECGERTGNLFDKDSLTKYGATASYTVTGDTVTMVGSSSAGNYYYNATLLPAGNYSLTFNTASSSAYYILMASDSDLGNAKINNTSLSANQASIAARLQMGYARFIGLDSTSLSVYSDVPFIICFAPRADEWVISTIMLNTGSTPLPYEPWGIKIPILSGGVTTPVYLGEVQTTRRIKKLMFDGAENVSYNARNDTLERWVVTIPTANGTTIPENVICTHFKTVNATAKPLSEGGICMRSTGNDVVVGGIYTDIGITAPSDSTTIVNAVKAYLTQQYSAGTPVCVWYVLATPQTAVVNEPLRKIGTYADEVSGITIPTIAGENAVDVLTTLKPSEVTATYKGWHPIVNGHESESGQWD